MNLDIFIYIFIIIAIGVIIYFGLRAFLEPRRVKINVIGNENFTQKDLYNISQLLRRHDKKIKKLHNMDDVKMERIKLELELSLNLRLKQLYKYINLYPTWYNDSKLTSHNEPFWYSTAITPDQLTIEKLGSSDFNNLIDNYYLNENTEILNYSFKVNNENYNLVYIKTFEYFKSMYIYKNKTDLAYKYNAEILAFKPGVWILHLLKLVNAVSLDEIQQSKIGGSTIRELNDKEIQENFLT